MVYRGFLINNILPSGVQLNVLSLLNETGHLSVNERTTTRQIASL